MQEKQIYKNKCPCCNTERIYKSKQGEVKGRIKNCNSCANSISAGGKGNVKPIDGKKTCIDCKEEKLVEDFHTRIKDNTFTSVCKECNKKRNNVYHKEYYRYKKYGITVTDYLEQSELQESKCAICEEELTLFIDHCHTTNNVRGLLCRDCNLAIGLLKDNINSLNNAINYLNEYKNK